MRRLLTLAAAALLLTACSTTPAEMGEASAPSVGKTDSMDRADHGCAVVLRTAQKVTEYPMGAGGPPSTSWELKVDVDATRADVRGVGVLMRSSNTSGRWYEFSSEEQVPGDAFVTHRFALRHFVESGAGLTIDVVPFVRLADRVRLFDHNRVADDQSYRLDAGNAWAVAADADVCPDPASRVTPHYILSYPDFETTLEDGPVTDGGHLKVTYDGRRLRETQDCLGSEGPVSGTTIRMFHVFDDGDITETTVEQYTLNHANGCPETPCVTQEITEPLLRLPAGARSLALWFACVPGFSYGAQEYWQYDSNYGANYVLPVE
jgi:hypothetical protein